MVDDASRWNFVALLRHANMHSTSQALRLILRYAANGESVLRTKILRTDNGGEFRNILVDKLLAEGDIMREFTCVGTSHQNPVAERAIGVLFSMARTMLVDSSLPPSSGEKQSWRQLISATECPVLATQTMLHHLKCALAESQTCATSGLSE